MIATPEAIHDNVNAMNSPSLDEIDVGIDALGKELTKEPVRQGARKEIQELFRQREELIRSLSLTRERGTERGAALVRE